MAKGPKRTVIDNFAGINNVNAAERLQDNELREAVNVDVDDTGRLASRGGYTQVYSGTNIHSFWSDQNLSLFVEDGALKQLNSDFSATELRTGVARFKPMAYEEINGDVYYSDTYLTGVITSAGQAQPMSTPTPPTRPALVPSVGILPAGQYGVTVTAVDATGRESGAPPMEYITLNGGQAITVSNLPSELAGAALINVYCTQVDGDVPYLMAQASVGTTSIDITTLRSGAACRTMNLIDMAPGHILAEHANRLYIAVDNFVFYSEPYMYGLRKITNFLAFPERVTMLAPAQDGMFISSDKLYHLFGTKPEEFGMSIKSEYPAVEGTAVKINQKAFGEEGQPGDVWIWLSGEGVVAGLMGGSYRNLTEGRYAVKNGAIGSGVFFQKNGKSQYLSIVRASDEDAENLYTTDVAVADIRRNGVIIT